MPELGLMIIQNQASLDEFETRAADLESSLTSHDLSGVDLVILPELFCSGYNVGPLIHERAEPQNGPIFARISEIAKQFGVAIHYGYAEKEDDILYNSAQLVTQDGKSLCNYRKQFIPPGVEEGVFTPHQGDCIVTFKSVRIATLICYDAEFPENMRRVATKGADLVIVPTALSAQWGIVSDHLIATRSFENGVFVAYANQAGREGELDYYGGSCFTDPWGRDLDRAAHTQTVLNARIDTQQVRNAQSRLPYVSVAKSIDG